MEKYKYSDAELSFMENSRVPFAVYQLVNGAIVTIALSQGFIDMFGFKGMSKTEVYELLNKDMYQDVYPDDLAALTESSYNFVKDGDPYDVLFRRKTNGEYRIIHCYGTHVIKDNGAKLAFVWYMDLGVYKAQEVTSGDNSGKELRDELGRRIFDIRLKQAMSSSISGSYARLEKENAQLKEEADAGRRIAELQESVTALLTNMPAMTFSKDVNTRKYLACNQAFADYAHKETPDGVVGLTDFEIFDWDTANHFVEDDKIALSMDKTYIFYENVPDATGHQRQFQTTKLKFTDNNGRQCLLGLCQDVTDAMRIKKEYLERLEQVQTKASTDALTGVKNKTAYKEAEKKLNRRLLEEDDVQFAITILDLNDLKKINDTKGHQAGDEYIREACSAICRIFKFSPVFRIGGDEFAVISQGEDYENIDALVDAIAKRNEEANAGGRVVIACGMAKYEGNGDVASVFTRADTKMYENKKLLKKK
ncbi:diguanylate cyclase domain-containing protein [Butyrivibrio sp. JL13D10]|uniref:sensor domain-containing diguanylate cyclase n=1 Tax=Butyrivibrio sp. JL13D10 TaxID=3236815 RepID=UPI0038B431E5